MTDSFKTRTRLAASGKTYDIFSLKAFEKTAPKAARLPFSLRILLERLEAVNRVVRRPDLQAGLRLEAVLHVSSGSPAGTGGGAF